MLRQALILDGLWYSLCPSFNHLALTRPALLSRPRKQNPGPRSPPVTRVAVAPSRRCYSSDTTEATEAADTETQAAPDISRDGSASDIEPRSSSNVRKRSRGPRHDHLEKLDAQLWAPELRTRTIRVYKDLVDKPESYLEDILQWDKLTNIFATTQTLRALIRDHCVKPSGRHYKALILAHRDPFRGSPEAVRGLLEEMEENGITVDSGTLHAILQVLAVHPNYLLRHEVLQKLRQRWLTLSPAGWHFVVAGLLREHQFELALEQVALMEQKNIPIENWLHSMMIYHLCDFQEFDEVYRLMRARVAQGHDITNALWGHVLNTASEAGHFLTTRYVWLRRVELGYLYPSAETCTNVLEHAARGANIDQANSVFRYLNDNNLLPSPQNYAQLIRANLGASDLPTVFALVCTMHEEGVAFTNMSTDPILAHMIEHKTDPRAAWQMLKHLKNAKRSIPLGAARVIAEVCERNSRDDPTVVDDALGFYKELYTLCPGGADLQIYNTLIRMCRNAKNREAAMFLVKEMTSLGVIPDAGTFESLVLMCIDAGNYRSGYMYFRDLVNRGFTISPEKRKEIRKLCAESVDEFAMRMQFHPQVQETSHVHVQEDAQGQETRYSEAEWLSLSQDERKEKFEANSQPGAARTDRNYKARLAYNRDRRRRKRQSRALGRYVDKHVWPKEGLEVEEKPYNDDERDMEAAKPKE